MDGTILAVTKDTVIALMEGATWPIVFDVNTMLEIQVDYDKECVVIPNDPCVLCELTKEVLH